MLKLGGLSIPLMPLLMAVTTGAVLITLILSTYHVSIFGTTTITGGSDEVTNLYFGPVGETGTMIAEDEQTITISVEDLGPGDTWTQEYVIDDTEGTHCWNIDFDVSSLTYDDPADEWYGLTWSLILVGDGPITGPLYCEAGYDIHIQLELTVDPLFKQPSGDYTFEIPMTLNLA